MLCNASNHNLSTIYVCIVSTTAFTVLNAKVQYLYHRLSATKYKGYYLTLVDKVEMESYQKEQTFCVDFVHDVGMYNVY